MIYRAQYTIKLFKNLSAPTLKNMNTTGKQLTSSIAHNFFFRNLPRVYIRRNTFTTIVIKLQFTPLTYLSTVSETASSTTEVRKK